MSAVRKEIDEAIRVYDKLVPKTEIVNARAREQQ